MVEIIVEKISSFSPLSKKLISFIYRTLLTLFVSLIFILVVHLALTFFMSLPMLQKYYNR